MDRKSAVASGVSFVSALVVFSLGPVIGYENGFIAGGVLLCAAYFFIWWAYRPLSMRGKDKCGK